MSHATTITIDRGGSPDFTQRVFSHFSNSCVFFTQQLATTEPIFSHRQTCVQLPPCPVTIVETFWKWKSYGHLRVVGARPSALELLKSRVQKVTPPPLSWDRYGSYRKTYWECFSHIHTKYIPIRYESARCNWMEQLRFTAQRKRVLSHSQDCFDYIL